MPEAEFNADMLRLARSAREFTQADLASASGVTQALISKIENKLTLSPGDDVVQALASALRFPVPFFYQAEKTHGFPHFHHRKRAKLGAKPLARIHAAINIGRQHVAKLYGSYERQVLRPIPMFDLDERGLTPAAAALQMREYWMLPRGPIENLTEVVEAAGGIVVQSDFGTSHMDGLSFRVEGLPPLFFLNSRVPGDRYRFTLAHELGHMLFHHLPEDDGLMERQADEFAAAFLMPAQEIRPYLGRPSLSQLGRAKPYWKVSIKSLIRRGHDLKMMSDHQYKMLNIAYNKEGYASGEPHPLAVEKPGTLSAMVKHHIEALGYSSAELAELLLMDEAEFNSAYIGRPKLAVVSSR
ncbi:helix-turn-helix domain-containing protein [Sphingomonas paucimobilis]|uniref:ImmA/IrrE family metallo-endopeptidase n=1 Tax=Sphingomonas paucimobilis TaxID=13689 RepID=A0A7Y2PEE1_SPHPI|nr:XRE family transcriptional regulator [Sphingomonas paucimobilis]NNG59811.1 ImmA/IrrE family metallo-endopeptidase [Sphingomonas paucimobilis]